MAFFPGGDLKKFGEPRYSRARWLIGDIPCLATSRRHSGKFQPPNSNPEILFCLGEVMITFYIEMLLPPYAGANLPMGNVHSNLLYHNVLFFVYKDNRVQKCLSS